MGQTLILEAEREVNRMDPDLEVERAASMTLTMTSQEEDQGKEASLMIQELEVERVVRASMMQMMTTPELAAEREVNLMLMITTTERILEELRDSRMISEDRSQESSPLSMRMLSPLAMSILS